MGHRADLFELFDLSLLERDGMDAWLAQTLVKCSRWFAASGSTVFLLEPNGEIRLRAVFGVASKTPPTATVVLGSGIAGTVLAEGRPRIVGDPTVDPVLASRGIESRSEIASSMVVPLVGPAGERLGVVNFSRTSGEAPFSEPELAQAETIGAHMAMALTNAQLVALLRGSLADLNQKTEKLEAVLESSSCEVFVFDETGSLEGFRPELSSLKAEAQRLVSEFLADHSSCEGRAHELSTDQTWIVHADPLSSGGGVLTIQDVTGYQRAQVEASRLRRLAEIGQMTAALAHEIRNPLTGIKGAAQLIGMDSGLAAEYSQVIQDEATKLEGLCNDFLEVSRPLKVSPEPAQLGEVAARVGQLWVSEYAERGVELVVDRAAAEPTISIDVRRVEQILHNLLRNALQACQTGDTVTVHTSQATLAVQDTGVGMDQEAQDSLFSPFFTTKADGTGLGLCNVRRIVDAHGATIDVWSQKGLGTKFEIAFPRSAA